MKAFLLAGASALILTIAAVSDASANPKNKFSDGAGIDFAIENNDTVGVDVTGGTSSDNSVELSTTDNIESFNVDTEVIGSKEMSLTVSNNSVVVWGGNGGSNSCSTGFIGAGVGCGTVKNENNSGNGGSASANTGSINFGSNTFDHFGGINSQANNTGNNVAQVADTVMPVNAVVNFRADCCSQQN